MTSFEKILHTDDQILVAFAYFVSSTHHFISYSFQIVIIADRCFVDTYDSIIASFDSLSNSHDKIIESDYSWGVYPWRSFPKIFVFVNIQVEY